MTTTGISSYGTKLELSADNSTWKDLGTILKTNSPTPKTNFVEDKSLGIDSNPNGRCP